MKEVQNMALGMLMVLFVVMSVLGAIGILIMFLAKKSRFQSGAVYVMAAFGLLTAYLGAAFSVFSNSRNLSLSPD